jgi:hypothetical protein
MTPEEIQAGLANFTGTEQYHRFSVLFSRHIITDGVKWLCDNTGCYWLLDAIASHHARCMKDPQLKQIQFWTLTVHPKDTKRKHMATLTCARDEGDNAFKQEILYTDFPMPEIKLWVQPNAGNFVIFLPSEY